MYVNRTSEIDAILEVAFPENKSRTVRLELFKAPMRVDSYWDGGSKNTYVFVDLATKEQIHKVHTNHPFFEANQPNEVRDLPQNVAIVEHHIFCGKDMGFTIYLNAINLTPLLPQKTELSNDEKIVLVYTAQLKSSYAGISNYRFHEAHDDIGITEEQWNAAKNICMDKKLLDKRGAITIEGRNAIDGIHRYDLRLCAEEQQ